MFYYYYYYYYYSKLIKYNRIHDKKLQEREK